MDATVVRGALLASLIFCGSSNAYSDDYASFKTQIESTLNDLENERVGLNWSANAILVSEKLNTIGSCIPQRDFVFSELVRNKSLAAAQKIVISRLNVCRQALLYQSVLYADALKSRPRQNKQNSIVGIINGRLETSLLRINDNIDRIGPIVDSSIRLKDLNCNWRANQYLEKLEASINKSIEKSDPYVLRVSLAAASVIADVARSQFVYCRSSFSRDEFDLTISRIRRIHSIPAEKNASLGSMRKIACDTIGQGGVWVAACLNIGGSLQSDYALHVAITTPEALRQ